MTVASLLANSRGSTRLGGGAAGAGAAPGGASGGAGDHNVVFHLRRGQNGRGGGYSSSTYHALPRQLQSGGAVFWRALVVASVLVVVHLSRQQQRSMRDFARAHGDDGEHRFFAAGGGGAPQRCVEDESILLPDSPPSSSFAAPTNSPNNAAAASSSSDSSAAATHCRCPDPLAPLPKKLPQWVHRHTELDAMAQSAALDGVEVVVLGDSIVEHFSGTWKMGLTPKVRSKDRDGGGDADGGGGDDRTEAHNEDAAEALATQAKAYAELRSKLNMVALGCSGDTTNQLLYHLMHGVLPPKLQPKVFVLMIGTNNLGPQWGCNARTTLAGILHVAQHLHKERPQATVVLHSLLPRTDADGEAGPLNRYWSQILWINLQLQKFSALHPEWRFTNPNSKLLRADKRAPYKVALKPGVMPDGLHPSPEGYEIWSRELTKVVARALEEHDKRQAKNEKDGRGRRKEQPGRDRRPREDAR